MMYKVSEKKTGSDVNVNEVLAQELRKRVIKKLERRKARSSFKDTIWAAGVGEMQSLSSFHHRVKYSLCVIDIFTE